MARFLHTSIDRELENIGSKHSGLALTLRWGPGHVGIEGNEAADVAAKKASTQEVAYQYFGDKEGHGTLTAGWRATGPLHKLSKGYPSIFLDCIAVLLSL
ncbi:MAG TPA: hypothetical protein VGO47_04655, partial [Chlamydiales bacterium]|nr:hypothetical protein [Chlamydiales bacterium]